MFWLGFFAGIAAAVFGASLFLIIYLWPCWQESKGC